MSVRTIQVSSAMREELSRMKTHPRESYNEVLERVLEDLRELDEKTTRQIVAARLEIRAGRFRLHEQVRERFQL